MYFLTTKAFTKTESTEKRSLGNYNFRNTLNFPRKEKQDLKKYDNVYVELTAKKTKVIFIFCGSPKIQAADDTGQYDKIKSVL